VSGESTSSSPTLPNTDTTGGTGSTGGSGLWLFLAVVGVLFGGYLVLAPARVKSRE
jgi:hypothetical protein